MGGPFMPIADVSDDTPIDTLAGRMTMGELKMRAVFLPGQPYSPPHRQAEWLSSEDVREAIAKLAEAGMDKAACWDFNDAVNKLVEIARNRRTEPPHPSRCNERGGANGCR